MLRFQSDVALDRLNSFGLPARAAQFARIESAAELQQLVAERRLPAEVLILGGGSNLIFAGDLRGLVLQVAIAGRRLVSTDAGGWLVEAGAGENWHRFVRWCLERGWPGLENLSLIPGTVGAAPIQNIGAYGLEMAERFDSLVAVELASGKTRVFDRADCAFAYRDSVFKHAAAGRFLITSVRFRLPRTWQARVDYGELRSELARAGHEAPTAIDVSDAVIAIRKRKLPDPALVGNAGSFFKNPLVGAADHAALRARHPELPSYAQADGRYKLAAGWLIERAGWKGRDLGPVGAYEKQALVLVNRGGACGADVLRAAEAIRADVLAQFGIELEAEPVVVGG